MLVLSIIYPKSSFVNVLLLSDLNNFQKKVVKFLKFKRKINKSPKIFPCRSLIRACYVEVSSKNMVRASTAIRNCRVFSLLEYEESYCSLIYPDKWIISAMRILLIWIRRRRKPTAERRFTPFAGLTHASARSLAPMWSDHLRRPDTPASPAF